MNKLIRLSPTGIDYGDYAWNFASGCGNQIDGKCKSGGFRCWAYSITQRFEAHYPNGFKPTIYPEALLSPLYLKKPSRILCVFMGDLFWDCPEFNPDRMINVDIVPGFSEARSLKSWLFKVIRACPQHTFLFLTKQPQNLAKFSPFPDNCWPGVSITTLDLAREAIVAFAQIEAKVKFASYEPCFDNVPCLHILSVIDWLIIGSQTKPFRPPSIKKVQEIVEAADKAGIPVWLKDNLRPLFKSVILENTQCLTYPYGDLRQAITGGNIGNSRQGREVPQL